MFLRRSPNLTHIPNHKVRTVIKDHIVVEDFTRNRRHVASTAIRFAANATLTRKAAVEFDRRWHNHANSRTGIVHKRGPAFRRQ